MPTVVEPPGVQHSLRHVLVVGGALSEWSRLDDGGWDSRVDRLGEAARRAGAQWLTLRPYEQGEAGATLARRERTVAEGEHSVVVIVDPTVDGRARFASAMQALDPTLPVNESTVAAALYAPARSEPDLVVVLGSDRRLPASLVWELGYAELVYADTAWQDFGPHDLEAAVEEFAGRSRRFGGLP